MILGADPGIEVVGQGDDGNEAVTLVQKHRPDVLLMDVRMPGLDGIAATTAVSALPNPPKIIMLTTFDMDEYVFQALEAGASGFLLKDTPPQDLARAVHVVAGGDAMLSPTRSEERRVGKECRPRGRQGAAEGGEQGRRGAAR